MALAQVAAKMLARLRTASPVAKASMAYMACTFLQKGIALLTTPIFTRLLTTEQYGCYSVFHAWLEVIKVFSTLSLAGTVYMQALVKFHDERDRMTSAVACLGTVTTLTVTFIYIMFREQLNALMGSDTLMMVCILITAWEELMFDLWVMRQRVDYKFKKLLALTFVVTVAKPLLGILTVLATDTLKAEARILSFVAVDVLAYSWFFPHFLRRGRSCFDPKYWRYFLTFTLPLIPHVLTHIVLNQSDKLMIRHMVSYGAAGIYNLAHSLAFMLTLVSQALLSTITPWLFQRIKAKEFCRISGAVNLTATLVAAAGLCLVAVAPEIVRLFAPVEYHDAIWIIPPLVASVYFTYLYSVFSNFEYYYEAKHFLLAASIPGGLLNVLLNYIFIKRYGYLAAGWTTMFCFVFFAVAHYLCMRYILRKKEGGVQAVHLRALLLITAFFLLLAALCMMTYNLPILRYALLLIGCALLLWKREKIIGPLMALKKK